jgi:hypothetical protein
MAQSDRDVLFANESFVVGMLQAVSGGSLVAAISQADALVKYAGRLPFVSLLTAMGLALAASVLAAYWKHQYKMWDVKAQVSASQENTAEAAQRSQSAGRYLTAMRRAMLTSVVTVVFGLGVLVAAFWYRALNG